LISAPAPTSTGGWRSIPNKNTGTSDQCSRKLVRRSRISPARAPDGRCLAYQRRLPRRFFVGRAAGFARPQISRRAVNGHRPDPCQLIVGSKSLILAVQFPEEAALANQRSCADRDFGRLREFSRHFEGPGKIIFGEFLRLKFSEDLIGRFRHFGESRQIWQPAARKSVDRSSSEDYLDQIFRKFLPWINRARNELRQGGQVPFQGADSRFGGAFQEFAPALMSERAVLLEQANPEEGQRTSRRQHHQQEEDHQPATSLKPAFEICHAVRSMAPIVHDLRGDSVNGMSRSRRGDCGSLLPRNKGKRKTGTQEACILRARRPRSAASLLCYSCLRPE
jgi:hypothetical protein